MPELRRDNTRTRRNRDRVPRLLTSLQAMWLLDLRERADLSVPEEEDLLILWSRLIAVHVQSALVTHQQYSFERKFQS